MALAYKTVSQSDPTLQSASEIVDNTTLKLNDHNLTWTVSEGPSTGASVQIGKIGYFATLANTTANDDDDNVNLDLWIAIANPPKGIIMDNLFYGPDDPYHDHPEQVMYNASYFTCTLRNASVPLNMTFVNNVQNLQVDTSNISDHPLSFGAYGGETYQSFVQLLQSYILGYAVWFLDYQHSGSLPSPSNVWNTSIQNTIFGTAADFAIVTSGWQNDGHRLLEVGAKIQDGKNLTMLIEELALNASLSLMSNSVFCNETMTQVEEELWQNKYSYESQNLLIAYGCSIIICLATVLAGAYAMYNNGESHESDFSSISNAVQNPEIARLFTLNLANSMSQKLMDAKIQLVMEDEGVQRFHLIAT